MINAPVRFIICLIALVCITACQSVPPLTNHNQLLARLAAAENLWQSHQITDYQYRSKSEGRSDNPYNPFPKVFSKSQTEPDINQLTGVIILVKNNQYAYSYYENDPDNEAHHFGGFNKAFTGIRETLGQMQTEPDLHLEVDFHPVYGYPTRMVSRQYEGDRLISISFSYNDHFQFLSK